MDNDDMITEMQAGRATSYLKIQGNLFLHTWKSVSGEEDIPNILAGFTLSETGMAYQSLNISSSDENIIITDPSNTQRVIIGRQTSSGYGMQVNNQNGTSIFKLWGNEADLCGWILSQNSLSKTEGTDKISIDSSNKYIRIQDGGNERVLIGKTGTDYGIHIKDASGDDLFKVAGTTATIAGVKIEEGLMKTIDPAFASGLQGWQISKTGDAEFGNLVSRGMIQASTFSYDNITATAGSQILAKSAGALHEDMAAHASSTWNVKIKKDPGGATGFANSDICRIKALNASGGIDDIWFTLSSADTSNGTYDSFTCTYNSGNRNVVYYAGTAVVDYGASGQGYIYSTAISTSDIAENQNAPYTLFAKHSGSPWSSQTSFMRLGELNGSYGYSGSTYGMAIGEYPVSNRSFITMDSTNGLRMMRRYVSTDTVLAQWEIGGTIYIGNQSTEHVRVTSGAIRVGTSDSNVNIASNTISLNVNNYAVGTLTTGTSVPTYPSGTVSSGVLKLDKTSGGSPAIHLDAAGVGGDDGECVLTHKMLHFTKDSTLNIPNNSEIMIAARHNAANGDSVTQDMDKNIWTGGQIVKNDYSTKVNSVGIRSDVYIGSVHTDHGDDQDDCFVIGGHYVVATNDTDDELGFASIDGHTNEAYLRRKQNAILAYGPISANMENTYHASTNKYVFKEEGSTEHGIMWKVFTGTTASVGNEATVTHGIPNGMQRIVGVMVNCKVDNTAMGTTDMMMAGGGGIQDEIDVDRQFQTYYDDTTVHIHTDSEADDVASNPFTMSIYYTAYDLY